MNLEVMHYFMHYFFKNVIAALRFKVVATVIVHGIHSSITSQTKCWQLILKDDAMKP